MSQLSPLPPPHTDDLEARDCNQTNDIGSDDTSDEGIVVAEAFPPNAESKTTSTTRMARMTTTNTSTRKKKGSKTHSACPKDILGPAESFPDLLHARMALNQRVPWFKDHPIPSNLPIKYRTSPPDFDWENAGHKEMDEVFPFWKMTNGRSLGRKQIPKCLVLDSQSELERLVLINWWRSRTGDEQVEIASHQGLQRYYRAPKRSASPFLYAQKRYGKDLYALDLVKEHEQRTDREARVELAKELEQAAASQKLERSNPQGEPTATQETSTASKKAVLGMKTSFVSCTLANAPLGFRAMQSTYDLVQRFNLSVDVLYCARTITEECAIEDCVYPALDQNRGCCALHKQNWWVRKIGAQPQRRRGHLLLGPEYATRRTRDDIVVLDGSHRIKPVPCGCSSELCEAIGWSADTARVPKYCELPDGLVPGEHRDKDRPLRLAPWHFPPSARLQLPDGSWITVFGPKPEDFVTPDYDISKFLEEPGMMEYQERKKLWQLPAWVYEMQEMEQGPPTLAEYQLAEIRKQQKMLMFNATVAALSHKNLIQSHSEVTAKVQVMKKNFMNQKRVAVILSPRKRRMTEIGTVLDTGTQEDDDDEDSRHERDEDRSHPESPHLAPPGMTHTPNLLFAPGGSSLLRPQQAPIHATVGLYPYSADTARMEEAATRVWGHYYANYGRHI